MHDGDDKLRSELQREMQKLERKRQEARSELKRFQRATPQDLDEDEARKALDSAALVLQRGDDVYKDVGNRLEQIIDSPDARDRDVIQAIREAGRMIGAYQPKPEPKEPVRDTLHAMLFHCSSFAALRIATRKNM